MTFLTDPSEFIFLAGIWIIILVIFVMYYAQHRGPRVWLLPQYLGWMVLLFFLPAIVRQLPYFNSSPVNDIVSMGFTQATTGIVGLFIGGVLVGPFLWRFHNQQIHKSEHNEPVRELERQFSKTLPYELIGIGVIAYLFIIPVFNRLPTLQAFSSGLALLLPVGMILLWWRAAENNNTRGQFIILLATAIFPIYTIVTGGFLSFGSILMFNLVTIIAGLQRKKTLKQLLAGIIFLFFGLSVFVSWFSVRNEIRQLVWYESDSNLVEDTLAIWQYTSNFQLFDLNNQEHLNAVDIRLNYNYYVGSAVQRITSNIVEPANGATIRDSFLMLIPRVIWRDKPLRVGGDDLLTQYAGIDLLGSTSSSLSHVGEAYINYQSTGVLGIFIVMGSILSIAESASSHALKDNNWFTFAIWVAGSIAINTPEAYFLETTAAGVSAALTVLIVRYMFQLRYNWKRQYNSYD